MKATLEFNLDDPQDEEAHARCVRSLDITLALNAILNSKKKYLNRTHWAEFVEESKADLIDAMYQDFWSELNDRGIDIDRILS